jgi:4'-phosphopantetheinyl transferase EntD
VVEELFVRPAIGIEAFRDPPDLDLFPAEAAAIARAVPNRVREYATVRRCARAALAQLGLPPAPILAGERGAPRWPDGIVGSMTHCAGYRAAVVGRVDDVRAVGIDAEPNQPLPDNVLGSVSLPAERDMLAGLAGARPAVCWDRLLFSAKEAVYKAWYPQTGRWLNFEDALVDVCADGSFTATLLVPGPVTGFSGRWAACDGLVGAAIVVPA